MTSVNKANNVLTAPTATFKLAQPYGPIEQRQTSLNSPNAEGFKRRNESRRGETDKGLFARRAAEGDQQDGAGKL